MQEACLIRTDRRGIAFWFKDYRVQVGDRIEWIWTSARSLAMRLPRDVANGIRREIVASESIAVGIITVDSAASRADCTCTAGAVCRQNAACPRLVRDAWEH